MSATEVRARLLARLCRLHTPRHLLLVGTRDEALCRSLAETASLQGATLHIATRDRPDWLSALRARVGDSCIVHVADAADVLGLIPVPDIAWIDDDANWYSVHGLLEAARAQAARLGRPFPLTLVAGAGWPNGRRDSYADPQAIPATFRHPHERAGLVPGRAAPGPGGLFADRYNAITENAPGTGVLTAVEDFLSGRADELRLTVLPGFGGLAALCSRAGPFAEAFAPAGLAQDLLAVAEALEWARLGQAAQLVEGQVALQRAEALAAKLRAAAGQSRGMAFRSVMPSLPSLPVALAAWLPVRRRLAALLPGRATAAQPEQEALASLRASPLFDAVWYVSTYGDVAETGVDPVAHYLLDGASELRDPGPYFSTRYYLLAYPDVEAAKLNPLLHYLASGAAEGRNPGRHFATRQYVEEHPEVQASGLNPLEHYVTVGRDMGWLAPSVLTDGNSGQG